MNPLSVNEFEFSFGNAQKSFKTKYLLKHFNSVSENWKFNIQRAAMRAPQWTATWLRASSTSRPAWTTWAGCWGAPPATRWSSTLTSPRSGISTLAVSRKHPTSLKYLSLVLGPPLITEHGAQMMIILTWQDYKIQTNELTFTFLILIPLKLWRFFCANFRIQNKET